MSDTTLPPELVWGLFPRFVGLAYLLAFVPILIQHDLMPGAHGLAPMRLLRERVLRDFPGPRRFLDQPTLLWLSDSDSVQRGMALLGGLCGAVAIYGGPFATYALVLAWILWLSLEPRGLMFPWDTMLQEVGFLVLFLPATEALPSLSASALPLPSVAFMARWLVIRLMLGFGKDKFLQIHKSDFLFLRGFFVWMPLPNPLGWWAHHAPAWTLRLGLLFMFFAEVIAPVLGLFAGPLRIVAFASLVGLMAGIQSTGNWGYFNLVYALLCVALLDTQASIFDLGSEHWVGTLTSFPELAIHVLMLLMFLVSLFYLPNNSWGTRSWVNWSPEMFGVEPEKMKKLERVFRALSPLRWIAPFRIVNGYGVFPPHSAPPVRLTPVLEGSDDGVTWKQYRYRFMPSAPESRPPVIAPYHARFDQWTYYVTMGMDSSSLFGSLFPMSNPYTIGTRASMFDLMAQALLRGDPRVVRRFGHNPFPDAPPKLIRVGILALTPTSPRELRETGRWWQVRRLGTLIPPRGKESWPERLIIPHPENFHPDLLSWKRRAAPLREMLAAYAGGMPVDRAVREGSDLTEDEVERFWSELVPLLVQERGDWTRIHDRARALSVRYGVEELSRFERVLERYGWLLRQQVEPYRRGEREPVLPVMSNYAFHMLLHEVILDGRAAFQAALREPVRVVERAQTSRPETQLWAFGQLRYDQLMAHVRCFRNTEMGVKKSQRGLPSLFEYYHLLIDLVPPDEEVRLGFHKHDDGEFTIDGFSPTRGDAPPSSELPARAESP